MTVTNRLALAREQQVFVVEESVKGTMEEPVAADLVRVINAPAFNQNPEYFEDEQFRDTRSKQDRIRGRFLAGEWSLETYIKPSGVAGTPPETDTLLECALGDKHTIVGEAIGANAAKLDVVTNAGNSTTKAYITDASTLKVGMRAKIVQTTPDATSYRTLTVVNLTGDNYVQWTEALAEAVDEYTDITQDDNTTTTALVADGDDYVVGDGIRINDQTVWVTVVQTTGFDRITFAPALTAACIATDTIGPAINYVLADDLPSMSIWHYVGHTMFVIIGASCDSFKMPVEGKEVGKFTFSGKFMKMIHTGTDEVGVGGIDDSAVTLPVLDSMKYSEGSVLQVESEIMLVSAIASATSLTVSRGYKSSTPAAHLAGVAITPWYPAGGVDVGDPVHGRMGYFRTNGSDVTILGASIELSNGIKYYEEEKTGTDYAEDYDAVEPRDVKATVDLFLRTNDLKYFSYAVDQTQAIVELPCGDTDGAICAARMPLCEWSQPKLSADTEIKASLECAALASSLGNDELVIAFL